ncbi:F0F1 ATP synthase subunit epsilon [Candidatus Entotheonella palauensis]|uniref:F0F1 ATP synthase subunit epsilon n=1 Tax=Candidatus Entotheonella palauensis TaxID=93172 RepID=UPI0021177A27|nr:F0F1 ATP synthase subunit epsilon [Candidatus Entotheonella palauensis]
MPLDVEIVTPNRIILQEQVDELNVPSDWGYIGILPGHTPLLTILGQGELMYRQGTAQSYMTLFWGYMEVNNDKVTILADVAEPGEEIDRARAESTRDRAEDRLRRIHESDIDFERARAALMRAMIRLQASSHAM